jgi:hypothetical protein
MSQLFGTTRLAQFPEVAMQSQSLLKVSAVAIGVLLGITLTAGRNQAQAAGECVSGYVWRDARNGDGVCVTPQERDEAKRQNANARYTREPGGGAYGPNTCRAGYVWREAFQDDVVCVTPAARATARRQNAESRQYTVRAVGKNKGQIID